jgi:hypothetical protein
VRRIEEAFMKKILLAALLLTYGALVEAPQVNAQTANQAAQTADGPETVVRGFYAWYLGRLNKDDWNPLKNRRESLKYLTPEFHKRVPRLVREMDADIIICAQDWDPKWAENFTVGRAQVRGSKATTVVRLPPFGGGDDNTAIKIKITLVKRKDVWRIDMTDCVN